MHCLSAAYHPLTSRPLDVGCYWFRCIWGDRELRESLLKQHPLASQFHLLILSETNSISHSIRRWADSHYLDRTITIVKGRRCCSILVSAAAPNQKWTAKEDCGETSSVVLYILIQFCYLCNYVTVPLQNNRR